MNDTNVVTVGEVLRQSKLVGYLAVDQQQVRWKKRQGIRTARWSETKRRYRLDLLTTWDEGFLSPEDEAQLSAGHFIFKGEDFKYVELVGEKRREILNSRFSGWD